MHIIIIKNMFRKCLVQNCMVYKKGGKRYLFEVLLGAVALAEVMPWVPWLNE